MHSLYVGFKMMNSTRSILNNYVIPTIKTSEVERKGLVDLKICDTESAVQSEIQYAPHRHPLRSYPVYQRIIGHLDSDPADLRSCRLVCREWNHYVNNAATWQFPISITKSTDIPAFLNLIDDPTSQFPAHHLEIYKPMLIDVPEINILFESIGHSIKTLILDSVELFSYPFLSLPLSCPHLELLALEFGIVNSPELPNTANSFKNHKHLFPSLKHILIDLTDNTKYPAVWNWNLIDQMAGDLVMFLLDSAPRIISLVVQYGANGEQLQVMDVFSSGLATRPGVLKRLEYLQFEACATSWARWLGMELNLKTLIIRQLNCSVSTALLSGILKATSRTLTNLKLYFHSFNGQEEFQLYFPCEMKCLEFLRVNEHGVGVHIHGGSRSLLKLLPKLRILVYGTCCNSVWMQFKPKFWQNLFHDEDGKPGGVVNKSMMFFESPIYIIDGEIVQKIKTAFPGLRVLNVEIDGNVLRELIHAMKDFRLEELKVVYFETQGGIIAFDSALTGIMEQDCQQLLEHETSQEPDVEKARIHSSIADLKYLQRLEITYKNQDEEEQYAQLDWVAVSHGILQTSVNYLGLISFKIDGQLLMKMLNKLPLHSFSLQGQILDRPLGSEFRNLIAKQFPKLNFNYVNW